MEYLNAILLGIIEGITEFLPISSTGHLIIAEQWLGQRSDMFNIVIQAGAILAVTVIYWKRIWALATGLRDPQNFKYAAKLAVSFLITAVLGFVITKLGFTLPDSVIPIAWALIIGGFWIIFAERMAARAKPSSEITWTVAIVVGLAQIVAAVFPGTSRSAATIFAALLFGTGSRVAATEFAFLVGIPTMYAASGYELLKSFRAGGLANEDLTSLAIAFIASTITAFVAVKWLLGYIQVHRFTVFAVYRIIFGAALFAMFYLGWVS
ncbi:undecaprenyl-diphosphate phosphatase [Rhizobium sp. L1K21]|uniref:undecaprenyl-diphosphate phosphatase n=1 Tax=Rhizobium sp. L1K21 TaxID=2954933 RepID=UPI0020939A0C|nr:undecaprenyl-diphosphate phosphatase [Rhizobium sp. L1K21]MCO6185458.1 undecaprenyl-diphosphate phosphatase [Rhizobium sp. L1K21]